MDDLDVVSGDDYFNDEVEVVEPEANGDATPVGDVDSEAVDTDLDTDALEPGDDTGDDEHDGDEDAVTPGDEVAEWLPGFEGRFRPGEEDKALESYRNLESEYSRRQNEFQQQIAAEREAAFKQAAELLKQQQPQQSVVQKLQERQQLISLAYNDPGTAFRAALEGGDDDTIDAVIQAVAAGDPELGIDGDYSSALRMHGVVTQMQQQQQQQSLAQQVQELRAQAVIQPAATSFKDRYAGVLENEDVATAFQRAVEGNWGQLSDMSDPAQVTQVLERSLQEAIGHVALTQHFVAPTEQDAPTGQPQQQVSQRPAKRRPHVEGAAATRPPSSDKADSGDEYGDDILAAAREIRPVY